jgi:diguanylate cyclase (GGDEF)-like protein
MVARYGGEEFAVILPATTRESAEHVAERIRRAVIALRVAHDGTPGAFASVSIGVAGLVPSRSGASSLLVATADRALYDAKRGGRNRISVLLGPDGPVAPAMTHGMTSLNDISR